jgi:hypothetical protein
MQLKCRARCNPDRGLLLHFLVKNSSFQEYQLHGEDLLPNQISIFKLLVYHPLVNFLQLPISHAAIVVECSLQDFLFEWMFFCLFFIDFDTEARIPIGSNKPAFFLNSKAFAHHIGPPMPQPQRPVDVKPFAVGPAVGAMIRAIPALGGALASKRAAKASLVFLPLLALARWGRKLIPVH